MLLSAAAVVQPALAAGTDASGTKELVIVAETYVNGYGTTQSLKIDEIRLVGDEIHVFSTSPSSHSWPGEYYPAYLEFASHSAVSVADESVADESVASHAVFPSFVSFLKSDPVSVTAPDRELKVVYFFATIDQPRSDLYNLRTFGDSTLLYRRADADGDSGWLTTDVDPGAGSTVGLDFTPAPAAPTGLVSTSVSATSNEVTLWFDESPTSAFPGQRFVRQYNISIQSSRLAFFVPLSTDLVAFDSQRFSMTDANGTVKTFGGSRTLNLPVDVYSWQVQVRDLPVFPDGTAGGNALATPWSEFSETVRFAVLPQGQQILLGRTFADSSTGITTVEWGPVAGAASYEVWINRVSDGTMVLHKTGLGGSSYETDALDPDNYRVWVRATHANGTRTSWSKFEEFTVTPPYVNVANSWTPIHDTTPTITWTAIPRSTQYKIALIDIAKEQAAQTMRFAYGARERFITAYTRTVSGSSPSHTVETPLAGGSYRIEITLSYSNGTTTQGSGHFILEPAGLPIPVGGMDSRFSWTAEDGAASYDVWVAYLGQPDATTPVAPPKWNFATKDAVTAGLYQLPADAPAGNYRIWLRPNMAASGQATKAAWNAPADFTSQGPLYRAIHVTVQGQKLTWEPVPGAARYRTTVYGVNGVTTGQNVYTTATELGVPGQFPDGDYYVVVQAVDNSYQSYVNPPAISVHHGGAPWMWNISNVGNRFSWNDVPGALSYYFELYDLRTNLQILEYRGGTATSITSPNDLPPGHYSAEMFATRTVNGRTTLTAWVSKTFDIGITAPSNILLNGSVLSWDGPADATYSVTVAMKNGRLDAANQIFPAEEIRILPYPWYNNSPVQSTTFEVSGKSADLQSYIAALYSFDPTATLVVSVTAKVKNPGGPAGDNLSAVSDPVEFTLPQNSMWTKPIIETAPQTKPAAPSLVPPSGNTFTLPPIGNLPSDVARTHIYRTQNGAAIDLEYVRRFQLRVTDLQSGVVRTFDESQIPELLQMQDEFESPVLNYNYYPYYGYAVLRGPISAYPANPGLSGFQNSLTTQLGLGSSVYKFEARVQYLPVILSTTTSDPYKFSLTDTRPDHINVAATPWSDWSDPLEFTVLPDGKNILPISTSPGTINPRPTFAWGSNTPNAQYEFWAENRATKQRVIHETLTNVHQFQSAADLPAGQYDWWVRIVGTTGPRNGWSAKQSLEIFAPAITTSVVAETVDATPVVSWNAASGAQSYLVTFTSTTTRNVVHQATEAAGKTSHRVTTILPNDTYSVSIQASLPNGARTAPGAVNASGGFVLKRMTVGAAAKNVTISNSKVSWQAVDSATRYNVWINYIDSTGKAERILLQDAFGTELPLSASLTQRPGAYRVWIRAVRSEAGQEYTGRWSEVKTLQVNAPASDSGALAIIMSELAITGVLDGAAST